MRIPGIAKGFSCGIRLGEHNTREKRYMMPLAGANYILQIVTTYTLKIGHKKRGVSAAPQTNLKGD